MSVADQTRRLWEHAFWANARVLEALPADVETAPEAWQEYAHIVAAEETWLARIEAREPAVGVWPDAAANEVATVAARLEGDYRDLLASLDDAACLRPISYRTSAGDPFTTPLGEILLHVALHGQYHRGKVNAWLRQGGFVTAPVDYIAFVRGAPAATTPRRM